MARPRGRGGGRVPKASSQTLPARRTQTGPLINRRLVQSQITVWGNLTGMPGPSQLNIQQGMGQQVALARQPVAPDPGQQAGHRAAQDQDPQANNAQYEVVEEAMQQDPQSQIQSGEEISNTPNPEQVPVDQVQLVHGAPGLREQVLLADRLNPTVPEPCAEVEEDADGWSMVDKVGGWD